VNQTETGGDKPSEGQPTDESKRNFLKVAATVSAALAIAGVASTMKPLVLPAAQGGSQSATTPGFPRVKVSSLSALSDNSVVYFNYPLDTEPNILVKLGAPAKGGVGPNGDIVAFSQLCQHLGCYYGYVAEGSSPECRKSYTAPGPVGYCCCHGSVYDFKNGAAVLAGPSPRPQPQVTLEVDSGGDIYAVGMGPPTIFQHNTGSGDVTNDLQGGNLVGGP
jgi:arsenite oxidase small subunit